MTQDEIIRMGMEAGMRFQPRLDSPRLLTFTNETLERFAALVAANEREACLACYSPDDTATDWTDKIRARNG